MKIVAILGPTAVGKTDISISIAKKINGEIINLDSIQIYKMLNIGSAKPTSKEMNDIPHHLIDFVDPFYNYTVSDYQTDAKKIINDIYKRNKISILTGGTGLYLNSLYYNMDFNEANQDMEYRQLLENIVKYKGTEYLHNMLKKVDEKSALEIHPNNIRRVIRALEINKITGNKRKNVQNNLVLNPNYDIILIGLTMNREELYTRINRRVDAMFNHGLLDEVKYLKNFGLNDSINSMKGIGYKEVLAHINGQYDYETTIKLIKQNSRHYAKRQLTWFKQYKSMKWFNIDDYTNRANLINEINIYIINKLK